MIALYRYSRSYAICFVLILTCLIPLELLAGSFTAEIDHISGVVGEEFILELRLEGKLRENLSLPNLPGLVFENRGRTRSYTSFNGVSKNELIFTFALTAETAGSYIFPALNAVVDGEKIATLPFTLTITEQPNISRRNSANGSTGDLDNRGAVFIQRDVSNSNPVVGEPFVLTTNIYVKDGTENVQLERVSPKDEDLRIIKEEKSRGVSVSVDGVGYSLHRTRSIVVALNSKTKEIAAASWKAEFLVRSARRRASPWYDPFGGGNFTKRRLSLRGEAVELEVSSIPKSGRPKGFTGVVGSFNIQTKLNSRKIDLGETATLTVSVQGRGLLERLKGPDLRFPGRIKVYADKPEVHEDIRFDVGVLSRRVFHYALVPSKAGVLDLGQVSIPIFDSRSKAFVQLKADLGRLRVEQTTAEKSVVVSSKNVGGPTSRKFLIKQLGHDLIDIHRHFDARESHALQGGDLLLISLSSGVPLVLLLLGVGFQSYRTGQGGDALKARRSKAFKNFQASVARDGSSLSVSSAYKAYRVLLGDKLGIQGAALTQKEVVERLTAKGVTSKLIEVTLELSEQVQKHEYSSESGSSNQQQEKELVESVFQLAREVDRQC